jgi:CheY-like chemotaxis protein/HPt (histidine-containing phosphotransfer) domain-containing protein
MILSLSLKVVDPASLRRDEHDGAGGPATTGARRMAPSVAEAVAEGTLVMVVDDHPTNRALLLRQVQALGYAGEVAEEGAEALALWKSGRYGFILTDCNMPELDGYALARAIRSLEAETGRRRTPIVACTAYALEGEAERCLAAGMDDYLGKPVGLSQLLKKLGQWLPIPGAAAPAPGVPHDHAEPRADPLDRSVLAAISGGDTAFESEILTHFRQSYGEDAATLEQAVAANDLPLVARASHRMLGASRMVGALGLAGACERIGQASRTRDRPSIESGLGAVRLERDRLDAYFDALLESA